MMLPVALCTGSRPWVRDRQRDLLAPASFYGLMANRAIRDLLIRGRWNSLSLATGRTKGGYPNGKCPRAAPCLRLILQAMRFLLAATLASLPCWALAQPSYRYTSLGSFSPYRISESGQIVGAADYRVGPALVWQDGVVTQLGGGVAQAINSAGQVVLSVPLAGDGRPTPHLWQNGVATPLAVPPWNSDFRHYYDMNSSGHVVGQALERAFLWADDRLTYLDSTFAGQSSSAYAINDAGKVIGHVGATGFLWDQGAVTLLPDTAMDINNVDQVLLFSSLWETGTETPIPFLPLIAGSVAEMTSFQAQAINNHGQVVARQREHYLISIEDGHGSRDRSLLWDPVFGSRDLADLVGQNPLDWTSSSVTDINSAGQIVGFRQNEGFLLTPIPEPATTTLAVCGCLALAAMVGLASRRRGASEVSDEGQWHRLVARRLAFIQIHFQEKSMTSVRHEAGGYRPGRARARECALMSHPKAASALHSASCY
jgi:uncharacterized membrane protein